MTKLLTVLWIMQTLITIGIRERLTLAKCFTATLHSPRDAQVLKHFFFLSDFFFASLRVAFTVVTRMANHPLYLNYVERHFPRKMTPITVTVRLRNSMSTGFSLRYTLYREEKKINFPFLSWHLMPWYLGCFF